MSFEAMQMAERYPYSSLSTCEDHPAEALWAMSTGFGVRSTWLGLEVLHSYQVVDRQGKGEHPSHTASPLVARLTHESDGLELSKNLFDQFALALADLIAGMTGRARVNRTGTTIGALCNVRSHRELAKLLDKVFGIVGLVSSHRRMFRPSVGNRFDHLVSCFSFGFTRRHRQQVIGSQGVAIVYQDVSHKRQPCFFARSFTIQPCLGIRCGLVRSVAALLAVEIYSRIATAIGWRLGRTLFLLEAFLSRPRSINVPSTVKCS